jgi:hypothetical protein
MPYIVNLNFLLFDILRLKFNKIKPAWDMNSISLILIENFRN